MKHISFVLFSFLSVSLFAQSDFSCGTSKKTAEQFSLHPELLQRQQQLEDFTSAFSNQSANNRSSPIIIPVVFHIIHTGGTENITDAQVLDEMVILNKDYSAQNVDLNVVVPPFQSIIGNAQVEFRLANIDAQGNCTNGIEHIYSTQANVGNDFSKLHSWPREKYLNVWVVHQMADGVAGYAYLPATVDVQYNVPAMDGVIILDAYIGSIGTASPLRSRALTHEIGHWLNLYHPWGPNNNPGIACGDDYVDDTPITRGSTSCDLTLSYCNPPTIENVQNFMDYSYCSVMFTQGQCTRMQAAANSNVSNRNNLWTTANLAATGTGDLTVSACAPVADFSANRIFTCTNSPVVFKDNSYNGTIDYREWTFDNADVTTSNDPIVTVNFLTPGTHTVTLHVLNAEGSSTITKQIVQVAQSGIVFPVPYYNDFEDNSEFNANWYALNYDNDQPGFKQVNLAGRSGNGSVQLENYWAQNDHSVDEFVSPAFDLSSLTSANAKLSFWYSYATSTPNFNAKLEDSMVVYASTNCGGTWAKIYSNGKNDLLNAGYVAGYFTPTNAQAYWRNVTINLQNSLLLSNVRFKVQVFGSHRGNNFYLDDWNIGNSPLGADELSSDAINVFPNPLGKELTIEGLPEGKSVLQLTDLNGRLVQQNELLINSNITQVKLNEGLAKGVYLLRIQTETGSVVKKLIKE